MTGPGAEEIATLPLERICAGEQGGHLEYLVSDAILSLFQSAVGYPEASFPGMAAREYLAVLERKYGPISTVCLAQQDTYYRPPKPGKRVQLSGWVRETSRSGGICRLTLETFAVDEDGTEISRSVYSLQSQRTGAVPSAMTTPLPAANNVSLPEIMKRPALEDIQQFGKVFSLLCGREGPVRHIAPSAGGEVPEGLIMAYLHEMMARRFGIDFRQGGRLSAAFLRPVGAGDTLTGHGAVVAKEQAGQRTRYATNLRLTNHRGEVVATGEGVVTVPSPLT